MAKKIIQSVKGTRDFYPEQMAVRTWLYDVLRNVAESFGYQEYEAPMLETLELYAAKSSDEIVREQSYVFKDRSGTQITLRPELTPSLARMVAQRQNRLTFPLRWWSFGPFWRYERPQKGRSREFFQWNVDLLGADSPEADAENVAVLATLFRTVGLTPKEVLILVSDRRLLDAQLAAFDVPEESRAAISAWIDRREKMAPEVWEAYGSELGLSVKQVDKIKKMLEDKELWRQSVELPRFFKAVEILNVGEYVQFDAGIVRGFTYYTGTVFEAWEVGGDIRRSILGGGRYDNLLADIGGEKLPAVGFAMGDVVMLLLLEKYGLLPKNLPKSPAQVLVTVFNQEHLLVSLQLANKLRTAGINVICYPEAEKLPRQFKYADRIGMRAVIVIGPDEVERGEVTIKDLAHSEQRTLRQEEVVQAIKKLLAYPESL
jgi:histidyl-tRNA synthetase